MSDTAARSVHFRIKPALEARVRRYASDERRNFSNAISMLIEAALDARDKEMEDSR